MLDALLPKDDVPGRRFSPAAVAHLSIWRALSDRFGTDLTPVRVVGFDKSEGANWGLAWHQDRVIAVAGRDIRAPVKNWTRKAGLWHCEPSPRMLDQMLFVRLHLDPCDSATGAMQIVPGAHRTGIVSKDAAKRLARAGPVEICAAARGDVHVLHMLTVHASRPSQSSASRRVLRVDLAAGPPPSPLRWHGPEPTRGRKSH